MDKKKRALLLFAIALMGVAAFLPIWRIEIWAPQYPEGIVMQIMLNDLRGNVDQVNILNHYIGMKNIVPAEIPELWIVPLVFAFLLSFGLLAVFLGKLWLARAWFLMLKAALFLGIIDLYLWGYDYGHNLNPHAPIKVPGMSYQPPLIGHKNILNIDSYSLPDYGGMLIALGVLIAGLSLFGDILWPRLSQIVSARRKS